MELEQVILDAGELLASTGGPLTETPDVWFAVDANGDNISANDPRATRFTFRGALIRCCVGLERSEWRRFNRIIEKGAGP